MYFRYVSVKLKDLDRMITLVTTFWNIERDCYGSYKFELSLC